MAVSRPVLGKMQQTCGQPGVNVSMDKNPLCLGGHPPARGIGAHAASPLWIDPEKAAVSRRVRAP